MSQAQDMAAINDLFQRTTPSNGAAQALKDTWSQWYGGLDSMSRDYDSDILSDASARRDAFNRAQALGTVSAPAPVPIIPPGPQPTIKQGSNNAAVKIWQHVVGAVPEDGIFGSKTAALTKTWQKAHGLVADGIVGPQTWAQAQANSAVAMTQPATATAAGVLAAAVQAAQATTVNPPIVIASPGIANVPGVVSPPVLTSPILPPKTTQAATTASAATAAAKPTVAQAASTAASANARPTIKSGSTGASVVEWQKLIGITPADGVFGPDTTAATRTFQMAHSLSADGIVGPQTWATGLTNPSTAPVDIGSAVGAAADTIKATALDLHANMPLWLKVTTGALAGLSAILGLSLISKSKRAA
jgi:peptidoglycan hydrolase-like protein with peptidoglycan-binding domain